MAISIAVTIVVIVSLTVQNILQKNSEEISKLHQGIIYNINSELKDDIQSQKGVERVGLCTDVTTLDYMGKELFLFYYDNGMLPSKTSELIGNLPKEQYDIVLSENMLKQQGVPVQIGQRISLNIKNVEYVFNVSGILKSPDQITTNYVAFISKKVSAEILGTDRLNKLNAYIWLKEPEDLTKEEATELIKSICDKYGLSQWSISSYYDYIEQTLPIGNFIGYIFLGIFLLVVAGLVIYSVFYISVENKTAQYGQLRTIGAGKKQIYKMVILEGAYLAIIGELAGIVLGFVVSYLISKSGWTIRSTIVTVMIAIFFGTILTYLCVRKPAKIASSVSPIAAIQNVNYSEHCRLKRKRGRIRITPAYIAYLNIMGNRKKTLITILSMSICAILFMLSATYYSSFNAESMTRIWDMAYGNYELSIDLDGDNINEQLKSNFFTDDLLTSIGQIEGVKRIKRHWTLPVEFEVENVNDNTLVMGYEKNDVPKLKEALIEGNVNIESDDQILVSAPERMYDVYHWKPKIGQKINISFFNDKNEKIVKEFTVAGITNNRDGMRGYIFRIPENVMNNIVGYDCTYAIEIKTDESLEKESIVDSYLREICRSNAKLHLETFDEKVAEHKADNAQGFVLAFALVLICGTFATLNQINLISTNLINRSKEIGILQAIGMTRKQLYISFIVEEMSISIVSIIAMAVLGIPGGYIIEYYLKIAGMSEGYSFPALAVCIYIIIVIMLQIILIIVIINRVKKYSIIEQLRDI